MSDCPLISVILPVYNSEKYIKASIESIINQTYKDFELIVIDDGSSDKSVDIIRSYMKLDKRIVLISRKNYGLVETLNDGLKVAKGKYIARMDSDDISNEYRFEKQINYLMKNQDIDLVGTFVEIIGDCSEEYKEKAKNKYNHALDDKNQEEFLLKIGLICHPTIMFKKDVAYTNGMYRDKYYTSEDYDFYLRLLKQGAKLRILPEKLLIKREHLRSKSSLESKNYLSLEQWINIKLDYLEDRVDLNTDIVIWGASKAGELIKKIIQKRYPDSRIVAFLDKAKTGSLEGIGIVCSDKISDYKKNYIICASQPGKVEIEHKLIALGLKEFEQYLVLV